MLPLCPASTLLRPKGFVKEEWDRLFSDNRALVPGGWRGILYANLAIIVCLHLHEDSEESLVKLTDYSHHSYMILGHISTLDMYHKLEEAC
jgi:endoglucanase Acf2